MKYNYCHFFRGRFNSLLLISAAFLLSTFSVQAQKTIGTTRATVGSKNLTFFVDKVNINKTIIFREGNATANQINEAIETVSNLGGGVVKILEGNYTLGQIFLQSNVRIEIGNNVKITIDRSGNNNTLFNLGRDANSLQEVISNVEIIGASNNSATWFEIDLSNFAPLETATPFKVGFVKNFAISRFIITDNYTLNPSVFLVADSKFLGRDETGRANYDLSTFNRIPIQGVVRDAKAIKIGTGYALVQPFSGKRIYMENLEGEQGITVRLEPGSGKDNDDLNLTGSQKMGAIDDIYIKDVSNSLGFAALFIKPHSKICNNIYATDLYAENSLSTLYIASASLLPQSRRGEFTNTIFENITFKQTIVNTVSSGTNDLLASNYPSVTGVEGLRFMSELHRQKLVDVRNSRSPKPGVYSLIIKDAGGQRYKTHPIAPIIFTAKFSTNTIGDIPGRYSVTIPSTSNITVQGGVFSGDKVVYRSEARIITTGASDTDYIYE
ncbi:hypothetical protein MY04_5385 [Flammeovirga sp. MY04]|uniref:hypothetical protein n=1 Tax=Flammeovirga sp. MY04 TaxID=1191459 RepID=UPI00082498D8|nr:hypothetical protein [Flammeovirga sp. MY04]ANQ52717.2 hypothetical protein MY04_5385 [Flammeovirga sp. MY04]